MIPRRAKLSTPGWSEENRSKLERWIEEGAGQHRPVVFDFDNTIVCGDIGEATLAMLVRDGILGAGELPETLCPPIVSPERSVSLRSSVDLTEYYEALLAPTVHGASDPNPLSNGYTWAVEIMQDLELTEVVRATQRVWAMSEPMTERLLEVTPGRTAFPIPFFYPPIVELIGELSRHQFDIWVVSASNVWSVRWMILKALNPLLTAQGIPGLSPDHVIGVSTLLRDRKGRLYKDRVLVCEDPAYARLEKEALREFRLTQLLQFPVPTYAGKVGAAWDMFGHPPYFAAGDSPGDHAILRFSQRRLWIARIEKAAYQDATARLMAETGQENWVIQKVRSKGQPAFLP